MAAGDCEREWASLSTFASDAADGAMLGLVYGCPRQGKSLLLELICAEVGGLYHLALEEDEALALRTIVEDSGRYVGAPGAVTLSGWSAAIEALLELGTRGRRTVVVLDEFPYLMGASGGTALAHPAGLRTSVGAPSALPNPAHSLRLGALDHGSSPVGDRPFRGRAGLDLLIHPFDFRQAAGFWGLQDCPELAFRVHAVLGGTPAYRDLVRGDVPSSVRGFDAWVVRAILDPASP